MPDIKHSVIPDAPIETAFKAINTKEGLERWWPCDVAIDQEGAGYVFGFNDQI